MPVKWGIFQDFSKNLRSALQLEGFVDALFVSSRMAEVLTLSTQIEDP